MPQDHAGWILRVAEDAKSRCGPSADGILAAGSRVYGRSRSDSDFDLYVLSSNDEAWRSYYRFEDADVDLFVLTATFIRRQFDLQNDSLIEIFAKGIILETGSEKLVQLQNEAIAAYRSGPKELPATSFVGVRHNAFTVTNKCRALLKTDPQAARLFIRSSLGQLIRLYFKMNRRWMPRTSAVLTEIEKLSPHVAELLLRLLEAQSLEDEAAMFAELTEIILEPIGGPLRYFERDLNG